MVNYCATAYKQVFGVKRSVETIKTSSLLCPMDR